MAKLINGKELAQKIRKELRQEVEELKEKGIEPKLAVIMIGENKASKVYVKNKSKACDEIGIKYEEFLLPEDTKMEELLDVIRVLNERKDVHAIRTVLNGEEITEYNIEIEGKNAVIIGRSNIVGKPLIQCLLNKNATVTVCHSKTKNISEITKKADILIAALGKAKFVKANMIKENAVVIDVGINRNEDGKLEGDVDFEEVEKKASYITPVPGGVGSMTIAMLINNVIKAAENAENK